jgi:hypothetical protein
LLLNVASDLEKNLSFWFSVFTMLEIFACIKTLADTKVAIGLLILTYIEGKSFLF